jgi:16S rRNA processing protein RimM
MQLVPVGRITKPHGLKGELKFVPFLVDDEILTCLNQIYLETSRGSPTQWQVESLRGSGAKLILKLKGCNSIEDAKDLAGQTLSAPREEFAKLPEGEYYRFDILGLDVFDEDGLGYGKVTDVIVTGSNDVYAVSDGKKEMLLPMIDEVIKKIDLEERKLIFHIIEGLLENDEV